eukprot:JP445581.1.p1 GENE.JP445581.1~~JP445581.1.p1  ORF type:complete len:57 (-),score=7.55 JP445581.1:16-186(-)
MQTYKKHISFLPAFLGGGSGGVQTHRHGLQRKTGSGLLLHCLEFSEGSNDLRVFHR